MKIPVVTQRGAEVVHLEGRPDDTVCAVHDWPAEGLARRLVEAMRAAHGKGGINVCVPCIERAKADPTLPRCGPRGQHSTCVLPYGHRGEHRLEPQCGEEYGYHAGGWIGQGPAPENATTICSRPRGHEGRHMGEEKT